MLKGAAWSGVGGAGSDLVFLVERLLGGRFERMEMEKTHSSMPKQFFYFFLCHVSLPHQV